MADMWEYGYIIGPRNLEILACLGVSPMATILRNKDFVNFIKNVEFDAALVDFKGNFPWLALCSQLKIPMITFWR